MQALGDHTHARMVDVGVGRARFGRFEAGLLRVEHRLVELLLEVGELAVGGECARDVRRVERIDLHAGVDEQQFARIHGAGVADPVQDRCVRAGCDDRVVADLVAFLARDRVERAFEDAFGTRLAQRARQFAQDVVEAVLRRVDGAADLAHLETVFLHARLRRELVQLVVVHGVVCLIRESVLGAQSLHHRGDLRVGRADHAQLHGAGFGAYVLAEHIGELGDVVRLDARHRLEFLQSRARAHPVFTVVRVLEEILRVVVGTRGDEQHRRVRAVRVRVEHEHRSRLVVLPKAGVIRECGIRAERIVAVVVAHLRLAGGDHEALAGERLAQRLQARGGELRGCQTLDRGFVVVPAAAHELHECVGARAQRAVVHAVAHRLVVSGGRRLFARLVCLVLFGDHFAHSCPFFICLWNAVAVAQHRSHHSERVRGACGVAQICGSEKLYMNPMLADDKIMFSMCGRGRHGASHTTQDCSYCGANRTGIWNQGTVFVRFDGAGNAKRTVRRRFHLQSAMYSRAVSDGHRFSKETEPVSGQARGSGPQRVS